MYLVVLGVAVVIISFGLSTIIHPSFLANMLRKLLTMNWVWPVSILRVIIGIIFVLSAEECQSPVFVELMGYFVIFAGIAVPILGVKRLEPLIDWFLNLKEFIMRIWGFVAVLFGIMVALAGMPA